MLIHLTPQYLTVNGPIIDLIDVSIPELKLMLKGGIDVVTSRPYADKDIIVVCRKKGRKLRKGFFIETDKPVRQFTVITRWAVDSYVCVHKIHYNVTDTDFDATTDDIMLWSDFRKTSYKKRVNTNLAELIPAKDQPSMVLFEDDKLSNRDDMIFNITDKIHTVIERTEYFEIPTIERERLTVPFYGNKRFPDVEDAFIAKTYDFNMTIKPGEFSDFGHLAIPIADWIRELRKELFSDSDAVVFQVLEDISKRSKFFYTNTNDLLLKAQAYSLTYVQLTDDVKQRVNGYLNQPVFHVLINE